MAIGLNNKDDGDAPLIYWKGEGDCQRASMAFADIFSTIKVSQIKPSNNHLVEEQRRRCMYGEWENINQS